MAGKVSLVGAGPGDPELLTLKALKAIESADAVVYDRLVSEAIMELVPPATPRFFVGKSCKQKMMSQQEIQDLLVELAGKHRHVVRLKGGDPLFFGRGGEEALDLVRHGIPFEIIPGITSAQGCSAYAGIPLTHRGLATGVQYLTGHRITAQDAEEALELNWQSLADPDTTLVVYMGLANMDLIARKLVEHGLPDDFPVAAITHGTTPKQRVVVSTLREISAVAEAKKLESPMLLIIGRVAALARELSWFDPQTIENSSDSQEIFMKMSH
jgi:uroporphyrin-III C-methyltransferase